MNNRAFITTTCFWSTKALLNIIRNVLSTSTKRKKVELSCVICKVAANLVFICAIYFRRTPCSFSLFVLTVRHLNGDDAFHKQCWIFHSWFGRDQTNRSKCFCVNIPLLVFVILFFSYQNCVGFMWTYSCCSGQEQMQSLRCSYSSLKPPKLGLELKMLSV